jgi:hypothetical protein
MNLTQERETPLNLRLWLPLLLGFVLLVTGVFACAPAAKTVAGTERVTEDVVSGTRRYIKKHGSISDKPQMGPDDPMDWLMWQDSQGGG